MPCLANDIQFSDLSVLRTKTYDFKLVYFFGTSGIKAGLEIKLVDCFISCVN